MAFGLEKARGVGWSRVIAGISGAVVLMLGGTSATYSQAATCNGFISLEYPFAPDLGPNLQRVRLRLTTGSIATGTKLTVNEIAFWFDCRNKGCSGNAFANCNTNADCPAAQTCVTFGNTCIDDGNIITYADDLTTTCATTWSETVQTNRILLEANPPLDLPPMSAGCIIEFTVQKMQAFSNDTTPLVVEQVASFMDADCDNGISSSNAQGGSLSILREILPPQPVPAASITLLAAVTVLLSIWAFARLRRRRLTVIPAGAATRREGQA